MNSNPGVMFSFEIGLGVVNDEQTKQHDDQGDNLNNPATVVQVIPQA